MPKILQIKPLVAIIGLMLVTFIAPVEARVKFVSLSGLSIPTRRVPGASRGESCLKNPNPVIALIPESTIQLTSVGNPTLFFDIRETAAAQMELAFVDKSEHKVYKVTYKHTDKPGIVSLPWSTTVPPLAEGKTYQWRFSLICPKATAVVEGAIQQRQPDASLAMKLKQAKQPQEKAAVYAENGYWQDSLTTLAVARRLKPDDSELLTDWKELLESVKLNKIDDKEIANDPLLNNLEVLAQQ